MNFFNQSRVLSKPMRSSNEELANMISHGIGLIAALIAAPILLLAARNTDRGGFFVGTIVFIATMLALYLASTLYHAWPETRTKCALQLFDHCAIFFLIAGTYTPFALGPLRGIWGSTSLRLCNLALSASTRSASRFKFDSCSNTAGYRMSIQ